MHATMACPLCSAAGIQFGATACPSCGVAFAAPVVAPVMAATAQPARMYAPATTTPVATAPAAVEYASIWRRMGAGIIDYLIVAIPFMLIAGPTEYFSTTSGDATWTISTSPLDLVEVVAWMAYVALMQSSAKQATLGMQALGLRIVRDDSHDTISFWRAIGRDLLTYLSAFILMIGYLMIAFTQKRQALHDKLADTIVVRDLP